MRGSNSFSTCFARTSTSTLIFAPAGNYHIVVFVTDSTGNSVNQPLIFPVTCTDDRDPLTKEYRAKGAVDVTGLLHDPPACVDYTKSASSSIFSFSQLTVNDGYQWALIRQPLTSPSALSAWVLQLGYPSYHPVINSGYRSPAHNAAVGGVGGSRHLWGDAIDLQNLAYPSGDQITCNPQYDRLNPWNQPAMIPRCLLEYFRMVSAARLTNPGYVEPPNLPCGYNCVHADWRNTPGDFQHGPADSP